jgi:hypothetical protein
MREQNRPVIADPFMETYFAFCCVNRKIRRDIAYSNSHVHSPFCAILISINDYREWESQSIISGNMPVTILKLDVQRSLHRRFGLINPTLITEAGIHRKGVGSLEAAGAAAAAIESSPGMAMNSAIG